MNKLIIFIRSYRNDLVRIKELLNSISKFNVDNIPVYIGVPEGDVDLFKAQVGQQYEKSVLGDDFILGKNFKSLGRGWLDQQLVKVAVYNTGLCENYMVIDSDAYFIKNFRLSDFMADENTPYTVMHQNKEFLSWVYYAKTNPDIYKSKDDVATAFYAERYKIMEVFGRKGVAYDCGPGPVIWSTKVWKALHDGYLASHKLTMGDLIKYCPSEFTWYCETLLKYKMFPIYPLEPIFKFFHYENQYRDYKAAGITEEQIAKNYFGIVIQSNWSNNMILKY